MRRLAVVTAVVALLAAVAAGQCTGPYGAFNIPMPSMPLQITQNVPENPSLDGPRKWQISLCQKAAYASCASTPASYVIEINNNGDGCDVGFDTASAPAYVERFGGLNMAYTGTYQIAGDRIANVTLKCNPAATTLTPVGDVLAHSSQGGITWNFDIVLESNVQGVCPNGPPGPPSPTPPTPPGPTPPGPTPPTPTGPPGPHPPPAPEKKEKSSWVAILFVVLVFVLPVVYVGAFVAYNYFKLGKRGLGELLPHQEFWKDFPVLCLDGCKFVKNKFLQVIGKGDGSGTYGGTSDGSYQKV